MGLWRDEVAVLFVRQVTAQALPYVKPALKRPACCIIVITVTKSQAAQIKPITAHHANQLYQHGTLALLVTYKQIGGFLTRFFLLVGLLASVVVFVGIYFAMRGRMPLHRLVFVLVLCFGMLYSFVLPPYAAPDDKYHINQSFTLACKWANMLSPDEWRMGNVPLDMTYRREHDFDPLLQNEKTTVFSWQEQL